MHQLIYPALFCATALFYTAPAASDTKPVTVQPLSSVAIQNSSTDWKQANQNVAKLGGWQFYASEGGGHQGMDHSKHSMPMAHSKHRSDNTMDHSGHTMPMDHSKHRSDNAMDHSKHRSDNTMDHSGHTMPMDHSKHSMPMDHSENQQQMDHSEHLPAKTGDEHEHHH
jgi:hypothetical protein